MSWTGIASPTELAMLTDVVSAHCRKYGITADPEREAVAERVMAMFQLGVEDPRELANMLETVVAPDPPPLAQASLTRHEAS
jgi:hypothetical protein